MADTKITGLTALTGANSAPGDLLTLVDVSDTTMDAAGTNKSITRQELQTYNAGTLTTDVKVLDLSATWNNAGVTFTGMKLNATDTASATASKLLDLQVGGSSKAYFYKSGALFIGTSGTNSAASLQLNSAGTGIYSNNTNRVTITGGSGARAEFSSNQFQVESAAIIGWGSGSPAGGTVDTGFYRDAQYAIAQRNSTNAQTFRLYNTYTNASNYESLAISWGSNIVSIKPENAGTGLARVLHISGLPTSNPGAGILWNNGGTPAIGT